MKRNNKLLPMSNEIQLLIGVPGSGKSTYSNELLRRDKSYIKVLKKF